MLTLSRLERLALTNQHDRLLQDVLRNGRPMPLAARVRLSQPEALAPAAVGFALQRALELQHRPGAIARNLAIRLLILQDDQGRFGTLASTAVALAALLHLLDADAALRGGLSPELRHEIDRAADHALHALASAQGWGGRLSGLFEEADGPAGLIGDSLDAAIVASQLARSARFQRVARVADLLAALDHALASEPEIRSLVALAAASEAPGPIRSTILDRAAA